MRAGGPRLVVEGHSPRSGEFPGYVGCMGQAGMKLGKPTVMEGGIRASGGGAAGEAGGMQRFRAQELKC